MSRGLGDVYKRQFLLFSVFVSAAALVAGLCLPVLKDVFSASLPSPIYILIASGFSLLVPMVSGLINALKNRRTLMTAVNTQKV